MRRGDGGRLEFVETCGVVELSDWILDVTWLEWRGCEDYQLAILTAHNLLIHHVVENGRSVSTCYRNEVSCILYLMNE